MSTILLSGQDLRLLATRAAVLAKLGSTIRCGLGTMVEPFLRNERIDLLVLCHTLSLEQRERLISIALEKSSGIQILQLVSTIENQEIPLLPGIKISICDPNHLVRRVEDLLGESARQRPAVSSDSSYRYFSGPWLIQHEARR